MTICSFKMMAVAVLRGAPMVALSGTAVRRRRMKKERNSWESKSTADSII
uniref:Secreted protein n=1 Tax=Heterorhabditis bacteriophora TaxID=37862 RepID=A0A1I7W7Q2_HETBA